MTTRSYSMAIRADGAARSREKILEVTAGMWKRLPLTELTLEKVAEESGYTLRTILRKFGSKEGLLEACIIQGAETVRVQRDQAPEGNVKEALRILLAEYEEMGDAVYRAITQQEDLPVAKKLLEAGRITHRQWCEKVFRPYLPERTSGNYETCLLAFLSATEVYLWKLLRRDLGVSFENTCSVFQATVEGLVLKFNNTNYHE